ncbi:hypothetical protein OAN10_03015 [Alphaproteobacteria bacterium]|nr:hypothetical protein [Alphaproteobacteria bacterium]|tara:strand:- start:45 stop:278 length:234 start_codon:yes stop_codon:yes gene_type:complete
MGFWTFLFGGLAAVKAKNMLTVPTVTSKSGKYEILSIKHQGIGKNYKLTYREKGKSSTTEMTITGGTRSIGDFEVHW